MYPGQSCVYENSRTGRRAPMRRADGAAPDGQEPFDIIFMDPPYDQGLERQVLSCLADSTLADEYTVIVVEASLQTDFSWLEETGYHAYKYRKYKTNQHVFLQKKGQINDSSDIPGEF